MAHNQDHKFPPILFKAYQWALHMSVPCFLCFITRNFQLTRRLLPSLYNTNEYEKIGAGLSAQMTSLIP